MKKNSAIDVSLDFYIRGHIGTVAVMGDVGVVKKMVEEALRRANKKWKVLDSLAMPSVDTVNIQRQEQSFFEAFFEMQGIKIVPEVLIIDQFNRRPPKETYFLKALLNRDSDSDQSTREYLSGLKQIFLILDRLDSPGAYGLDQNLQACIGAPLCLDEFNEANSDDKQT